MLIGRLVMLACLCFCVSRVWWGKPHPFQIRWTVSENEARQTARRLRQLADSERVRMWADESLSSRQAAWIVANAECTLHRTKALDPKVELSKEVRRQTVQAWRRLSKAARLSRLGSRLIEEEKGAKLRAYLSPVDSSLQTYSLTIPPDYDSEISWPLIVSMHGHGWFGPYQGHPAEGFRGAFGLSPQGRGATDYKDLGENDVLCAIQEVCKDFAIDRDRIYLKGCSMGGTGALTVAAHNADQFAGILPMAANSDYLAWSERWGWNTPFEGRFTDLRQWLQEAHSARTFAMNLRQLPTFLMHGSADTIVPPGHSRRTWKALQEAGCDCEYREYPGVGHGGFPGSSVTDALAWICAHQRNAFPQTVTWRADQMRHGKAYWVRMDQKRETTAMAEFEARVINDHQVRIQTRNLEAVSVWRSEELFAPGSPLFIDIDDERVIFPAHGDWPGWCSLRRTASGSWMDACMIHSPLLSKRAGMEGPIHDVFQDPFVLVVGSVSPDPAVNRFWLREAHAFASEWQRRNLSPCAFVFDYAVTDEMITGRHLILLGDARDNSVSAQIQPYVPSPLEHLCEAGEGMPQEDLYTAPDVGWFSVYPNPLNPDRLAVIHGANGIPAIYQSWKRFGNWFNWGVFDSKKYFDYAVYDARSCSPESLLSIGYYDTDWTYDKGKEWRGVPAIRDRMGRQGFPEYVLVPPMFEVFDLAHLQPRKIDQMRGALAFDRTYHGTPLPKGIGVRAPSVIEYDLDGTIQRLISGCRLTNNPENALVALRRNSERVRFIIKGDGKELASATLSWDHPEGCMEALLTGVKLLRLEVQPAGGPAWLHSGAAWLAPRLYR